MVKFKKYLSVGKARNVFFLDMVLLGVITGVLSFISLLLLGSTLLGGFMGFTTPQALSQTDAPSICIPFLSVAWGIAGALGGGILAGSYGVVFALLCVIYSIVLAIGIRLFTLLIRLPRFKYNEYVYTALCWLPLAILYPPTPLVAVVSVFILNTIGRPIDYQTARM